MAAGAVDHVGGPSPFAAEFGDAADEGRHARRAPQVEDRAGESGVLDRREKRRQRWPVDGGERDPAERPPEFRQQAPERQGVPLDHLAEPVHDRFRRNVAGGKSCARVVEAV